MNPHCPNCEGELVIEGSYYVCWFCGIKMPIKDVIEIMEIEELSPEEKERSPL